MTAEQVARFRDPLDRIGRRCKSKTVLPDREDTEDEPAHPTTCHRRFDHTALGDPWHYAMTGITERNQDGTWWRWRD